MQKHLKKQKPLSESIIQSRVIAQYERDGWLVVKIIQTTLNGWPDIQCHKNGITEFVECKAQGEAYDFETRFPLQHYRHEQLRKQGFNVKVIDYLL
jgi:hypothetical protein